MNTRRTRFLRQTSNQFFHLFANGHHQVCEFIHQHHDIRQFFQHRMLNIHAVARLPVWVRNRTSHTGGFSNLIVITGKVTHAKRRHQFVATFHFIDAPTQGIGGIFHVGHNFSKQMRNTFINRKFQHFWVNHDKANVFRLRFVQHAEDHGVHPNRLTGTGCPCHQQVRHFRQIGNHRFARNIFTQHHGQRR